MEKRTLQERVINYIREAERLSALVDDRKQHVWKDLEDVQQLGDLLSEWQEAARLAIHFCRLARLSLWNDELDDLIARIRALSDDDEERDLWEEYILGEWFDQIGDYPE